MAGLRATRHPPPPATSAPLHLTWVHAPPDKAAPSARAAAPRDLPTARRSWRGPGAPPPRPQPGPSAARRPRQTAARAPARPRSPAAAARTPASARGEPPQRSGAVQIRLRCSSLLISCRRRPYRAVPPCCSSSHMALHTQPALLRQLAQARLSAALKRSSTSLQRLLRMTPTCSSYRDRMVQAGAVHTRARRIPTRSRAPPSKLPD